MPLMGSILRGSEDPSCPTVNEITELFNTSSVVSFYSASVFLLQTNQLDGWIEGQMVQKSM